MPKIKRTAGAEEDLIDIWVYIAHDNVRGADRFLDEIEDRFFLLAEQPRLGGERPDIPPGVALPAGEAISHPIS